MAYIVISVNSRASIRRSLVVTEAPHCSAQSSLPQMGISRTVYGAWQQAIESRVSEDIIVSMVIEIYERL